MLNLYQEEIRTLSKKNKQKIENKKAQQIRTLDGLRHLIRLEQEKNQQLK